MAAEIKSSIAAKPTLISQSREDLDAGDIVTLEANDLSHVSYAWALMFTPTSVSGVGSAAALSAAVGPGPITFTVDNEGPYLVRLIADLGLPSESTQYVRLRRATTFSSLRLVAAGERKDGSVSIPIDTSIDGWSLDQNYNTLKLEGLSFAFNSITVDMANTPYAVAVSDQFIEADSSVVPIVILLPDLLTVSRGHKIIIKDSTGSASTNNITVTPVLGTSIDGVSPYVISSDWTSITLVSSGTNVWYIV